MKQLPLQIGQDILIYAKDRKTTKATCRLIGAKRKAYILIEPPKALVNERISNEIGDEIICTFVSGGIAYQFMSKLGNAYGKEFIMIAYPDQFSAKRLRRYERVSTQIPVKMFTNTHGRWGFDQGTIMDISEGGCRLLVPMPMMLAKNTPCKLDFQLPGGTNIEQMEAEIIRAEGNRLKRSTDIRIQFKGPEEDVRRIKDFCDIHGAAG